LALGKRKEEKLIFQVGFLKGRKKAYSFGGRKGISGLDWFQGVPSFLIIRNFT